MACRAGSIIIVAVCVAGCIEMSYLLGPGPPSPSAINFGQRQGSGINGNDDTDYDVDDNGDSTGDSSSDNAVDDSEDDAGDDTEDDVDDGSEDADSPILGGIGDIPPTAGLKPVITTDSGLKYIDFLDGQGDQPLLTSLVTVSYTGWLTDGAEFDSGDAVQFYLQQVIDGWTEGVGSMRVGGRRRLMIPPELGYGEAGSPPNIPGNATLVFDVELLDFE